MSAAMPVGAISPDLVEPEVLPPGAPYSPAAGVWQVGRMLQSLRRGTRDKAERIRRAAAPVAGSDGSVG